MNSSAREKIRQAAMELFAEKGYAATATREICEHAGVTKPTLYYYFQSKENLYRKLVEEAHEEARTKLREAARRGEDGGAEAGELSGGGFRADALEPPSW